MKRNRILTIIISTAMMLVMIFAVGCSKNRTLEDFVNNNEEGKKQLEQTAADSGLEFSIKGNNVVYTYDLKNYEGMTEELSKDEKLITTLDKALESNSDTFVSLCQSLEKESEISGITITVNYSYDGNTVVTKTFNNEGIVE